MFHSVATAAEELYRKGCMKWRRDSHEFSGTFDEPELMIIGAFEDENGVEKFKTITKCRYRRVNGRLLTRAFVWTYDRPISAL